MGIQKIIEMLDLFYANKRLSKRIVRRMSMTENEAIEFLKGKYPSWGCDEDEYENAQIAIQALEEIQAYRAIGTVDEIKHGFNENRRAGYKHGYANAIRDFAERIKSSQDAYSWCCADGFMEYCNGDHCESCMDEFKEKIDKIAEQALADMKKG